MKIRNSTLRNSGSSDGIVNTKIYYSGCIVQKKLNFDPWPCIITETLGAIPFNVHTPLWTRSIKFEPLRKKDQSADTNTPQEIKKFLPYPSEKTHRSKDADAHNPSETTFSNPLRNSRP
jgi:hypothetical protein